MSKFRLSKSKPESGKPAEIVFGADVVMTKSGGEYRLHAPGDDGHRRIGTFRSAAAVWEALDEIDDPMALSLGRAA